MASIADIRSLAEPLKGYQFRITIANAPGGDGADGNVLQYRCQASILPGKNVDEVVVDLAGFKVKYAGRSTFEGSWTTSFVEGTDVSVIKRVVAWQEKCHNQASGIQDNASDYKRTAVLELLDNQHGVALTKRIIGIWPQAMGNMEFSADSSEAMKIEVTWAFDYTEQV